MKKIVSCSLLVLLALLSAGCRTEPAPTEPVLEDAWIRSLPPGMKMTAGFGTLTNVTAEPIELVAFDCNVFEDVSLHLTEKVDGMSSMKEIDSYTLQPGAALTMEPGGYHLMLMGPLTNMAPGIIVNLDVTAADGRVFRYDVRVEKR
jgi:copper(I)-binding protein